MVKFISFVFFQYVTFWINVMWHVRLKRAVNHIANIKRNDIVLVSVFDRKPVYLDHFLDYYRKLGVGHFLLLQTYAGSALADASRDMADVSVFSQRFGRINKSAYFRAKNALLQRYGRDHLCVIVDCDEYLVYPKMETRSLHDLGDMLKNERRLALMCVAIDRYNEDPISSESYGRTGDPFEICPYMDRDHYFEINLTDEVAEVRGGVTRVISQGATPDRLPVLNRLPVIWWKWSSRITNRQFGYMPAKGMKILDWQNPVISGAVMRFPFLSGGYGSQHEHGHSIRRRYGVAYQRMIQQGCTVYDETTSIKVSSSDELAKAGLINVGNWF